MRVAGVNVGTVTGLAITPEKRAEVEIEVSGELAQLGDEIPVHDRAPVADRRVLHRLRSRPATRCRTAA